jgi:peptidoglycan/LPS O-acetylase OafA/YrhL
MPANWAAVRPWLLTYTLNFAHMFERVPVDDMYTHFWSLAVEEQFYLVWPFVVWSLSRVALQRTVLCILMLAPILRAFMVAHGAQPAQLYFFTPCQMDAFAAGAAVAVFNVRVPNPLRSLLLVGAVTVLAGVVANWAFNYKFAIASGGYPYYMPHYLQYVWGYSLLNVCAALTIVGCLQGAFPWLSAPWLVHIGRISYGIYVFHRPVIGMLDRFVAPQLQTGNRMGMLVIPALYVGISYALAWLSFNLFEVQFLKLKDRFYPPEAR